MPQHNDQTIYLKQRVRELEEQLVNSKKQERELRALIHNSPDILYRTDVNGFITYISPSVYKHSGYTVSEAIGMHMAKEVYLHAEEREDFLQELREKGEVVDFVAQLKRKDGTIYWAATNAHLFKDEKGAILGVEGITRDITKMMELDVELREIFSLSLDMICVADINTAKFTKVNPAFSSVLGFSEEELLNQSFLELVHPDDLANTTEILNKKLKLGLSVINFRNRFRTKNNEYRWLNWASHPVPERGITYAIAHDITDEMQAAEALQASERKFRSIIESSPMGIHFYELKEDGQLILTGANKAADTILNINHDGLIGLTLKDAFPPLEQTEIPDNYRSVCVTGKTWQTEQMQYQDDRISGAFEVYAFQTSPRKMAVFFLDVTNRKKYEEERKHLQEQLLHAQKMKAIGTLAGGIAHDFNNLLMGIQGRISLVQTDDSLNLSAIEHLDSIEEYIKSAVDLTGQLLGFARGGKYEVTTIVVNDLVHKSAEMFGRTRKEIIIQKNLPDGVWNIEGDSQQLHQVLLNLYVNAWQAMPDGGQLFLHTENLELNEGFARVLEISAGRYVKISVTDTGLGMDETTLQKIFEPFFTTKAKNRGTGLGLASAYGIIKNHSGLIQVNSRPGKGTTFEIFLPATVGKVVQHEKFIEEIEKGTETILLVDDEFLVRDVGSKMLQSLGYKVHCAASGSEAAVYYEQNKAFIDLVILDMIMPELDGNKTFNLLKAINPDIKVLLSSGYSIDGEASGIMSKGCAGFIQKPFGLATLSNKIKEILG